MLRHLQSSPFRVRPTHSLSGEFLAALCDLANWVELRCTFLSKLEEVCVYSDFWRCFPERPKPDRWIRKFPLKLGSSSNGFHCGYKSWKQSWKQSWALPFKRHPFLSFSSVPHRECLSLSGIPLRTALPFRFPLSSIIKNCSNHQRESTPKLVSAPN